MFWRLKALRLFGPPALTSALCVNIRVTVGYRESIARVYVGGHYLLNLNLNLNLNFDYVIRFRECITVTDASGNSTTAIEWVFPTARTRMIKDASVTQDKSKIPAIVVIKDHNMKEAWFLAISRSDLNARYVVKLYGKRFPIEEYFRDSKDNHFCMGMSSTHIQDTARHDRLLLLSTLAISLLTLLGAAGESLGYDRWIKVNTVKKRTHSLFRQDKNIRC